METKIIKAQKPAIYVEVDQLPDFAVAWRGGAWEGEGQSPRRRSLLGRSRVRPAEK